MHGMLRRNHLVEKPTMKLLKTLGQFVAHLALASALVGAPLYLRNARQAACEELAAKELPKIMAAQNKALKEQGIEHSVVPDVVCLLPDEARLSPAFIAYDDLFSDFRGVFMPEDKERERPTIYVPPSVTLRLPGDDLVQQFAERYFPNKSPHTIRQVVAHELGHLVTYEYIKQYNLPMPPEREDDPRIPNLKVVHEGIAEYFRYKATGEAFAVEDDYRYELVPGFIGEMTFYVGGFLAVEPVIEKHGKKGMLHLMKNPPTDDELEVLDRYQHRMLTDLAAEQPVLLTP